MHSWLDHARAATRRRRRVPRPSLYFLSPFPALHPVLFDVPVWHPLRATPVDCLIDQRGSTHLEVALARAPRLPTRVLSADPSVCTLARLYECSSAPQEHRVGAHSRYRLGSAPVLRTRAPPARGVCPAHFSSSSPGPACTACYRPGPDISPNLSST